MNEAWLAQVREDIIDAERPICDPHHHLWDHPRHTYLLPELLADTGSGLAPLVDIGAYELP